MSIAPGMRRATEADLPALTQVLARAFLDDPVACWSCPPERLRPGVLEGFHGGRLHQLLAHREVWTSGERSCAALWAPPGRWRTTWREDLTLIGRVARPRLAARLPLVVSGLLAVERAHPREPPHWYLAVLGTDPVAQGRGLGSAAMRPVLEQCDADGVGAYLESSK
jgi:ribosomal protein S18 acetylase RimI-like enzyme